MNVLIWFKKCQSKSVHLRIMPTPFMVAPCCHNTLNTLIDHNKNSSRCVASMLQTHKPALVHWWPQCCSQTVASRWLLLKHRREGKESPSSLAVEKEKDRYDRLKQRADGVSVQSSFQLCVEGHGLFLAPQSPCCLQWHWSLHTMSLSPSFSAFCCCEG